MTSPVKNRKIAAGVGVAAVAAAALALGAGTYASFSDAETGPGGTLAAGTLDLTFDSTPTTTPLFTASDIAPGYQSETYTLTYRNVGSLPGNLALSLAVTNLENGCNGPESVVDSTCGANDGELGGALLIAVSGPGINYNGTLNNFAGGPSNVGAVPAGGTAVYSVSYSLPQSTGNEVQSDSAVVTSSAVLSQQ
jgi:spore coat-associated protein N